MEEIIGRYNFGADSNDDLSRLTDELEVVQRQDRNTYTVDMALRGLVALEKQVAKEDFPSEGTDAYYMARRSLETIVSVAKELIESKRATPETLHKALMDFVLKMFDHGPGTTHCKLIGQVFDSRMEFKEYFQGLRGEELLWVITALKRPYTTKEKETPERLKIELEPAMRCFLDRHGFTEEQLKDAHDVFVDLFLYYDLHFVNSDEKLLKRMSNFAYWLRLRMDNNPYKGLKNVQVYRDALQRICDVLCDSRFPQNEAVQVILSNQLKRLFDGINENGKIGELYGDIMDFLEAITSKNSGPQIYKAFDAVGSFFFHLNGDVIKDDGTFFEGLIQRHIKFLDNLQDKKFLDDRYVEAVFQMCLVKCMGKSKEHVQLWIQMIISTLRVPRKSCILAAYQALREKERMIKWKEHEDAANTIFSIISKAKIDEDQTMKNQQQTAKAYTSFLETFQSGLKKAHMLKKFTPSMCQFCLAVLETQNVNLYELAKEIAEKLDFKSKADKDLILEVLRRMKTLLQDEDYPWVVSIYSDSDPSQAGQPLMQKALDNLPDIKKLSREDLELLASIFLISVDKEFICPDTGMPMTIFFNLICQIGPRLINMAGKEYPDLLSKMVEPLVNLMDHENDTVAMTVSSLMVHLAHSNGSLLAPCMEKLVDLALDNEIQQAFACLSAGYEHNPEPLNPRFQEFFDMVDSSNVGTYIAVMLPKVAEAQPQVFTKENVSTLLELARSNPSVQFQHMDTLEKLAAHRPELFLDHVTEIINETGWQNYSMPGVCGILKCVGNKFEEESLRVTEFFARILKGPEDQNVFLSVIDDLKTMVALQRPAVENQKGVIVSLRDATTNQYIKETCSSLLDLLEGRSLEGLSSDVQQQQEDIDRLDTRVTATELAIGEVQEELEKQKHTIHGVQIDLERQADRIQTYEQAMADANLRLDEIDSKTLSHAPFWAKDVAKVMNPEAPHDWRLLSRRLGYSDDDIRGWAQQADPCLAMLNEWFATHKTSQAIFGVLTALQDLNRIDAAAIVENAMKAMDKVIEEPACEYPNPPEVFLSYQWGHQNEVKLLKRHLEMAGFLCWMDIGQMGGGDKLFEKIDSGIRGAKVVLSCVSTKYARSPNCNREVQLSIATGKPVIPLLMEKMAWPPEGAMGPIFSEYLFIRFFQRPGEESGDTRYWPLPKFQELLMQLNLNGATPNQALVQPEYKDWWLPMVEEIKIEKKKDGGNAGSSKPPVDKEKKTEASPAVFLSYQWGKQRQVLALYKRLTALGLACWMDVFQMGGGDSLYDKIDRGLRGCKVVVACVTDKYALSANCRREVALSDALRKPLVPLLLEGVSWPPPGPMSMVLAPLLYVDFAKTPQEQDTWDGSKFNELLSKLEEHVLIRDADSRPESDSKKSSSSSTPKAASENKTTTAISTATTGKTTPTTTTTTTTTIVRKKPVAMKSNASTTGRAPRAVVIRAIPNVKVTQGRQATPSESKETTPTGKEDPKEHQVTASKTASRGNVASDEKNKPGNAQINPPRTSVSAVESPTSTGASSSVNPPKQPSSSGTKTGLAARKTSIGAGDNSAKNKGDAGLAAGRRATVGTTPKDPRTTAAAKAGVRENSRATRPAISGRSTTTRK